MKSGSPSGSVDGGSPTQLRALLQRWQDSLELHARYVALDNDRYQHIQPWPRHERPARWIVELARSKVRLLTKLAEQRSKAGDQAFIEGLELMGFLATLVGLSNVERYIPLCDAAGERREVLNATPPRAEDLTREMPQLPQGRIARMLLAQQAGVPYHIAPEPRRASTKKTRSAEIKEPTLHGIDAAVVDDALRLLGWGRQWHELAEIIGRLADRPPTTQIRRILRDQRSLIEKRHTSAAR